MLQTDNLLSVRSLLDRHPECFIAEPHGSAVDDATRELPAGGVDIVTAGPANRRQHSTLDQLVAKSFDHHAR
jgi:hypothetical protein